MITPAPRPRRVRTRLTALALAVALAPALTGCGDDAQPHTVAAASAGSVTVEDPWVRATTGTDDPTMTAAFMTIDNETDEDVVLESASSPVAGMVQLHEMAGSGDTMSMREVEDGIAVKAHGGQLLQPGGYHVMLMDLTRDLAPGDEVALTLHFSDGSSQEVTAPVKEYTEEEGHYHSPGTEEHSH